MLCMVRIRLEHSVIVTVAEHPQFGAGGGGGQEAPEGGGLEERGAPHHGRREIQVLSVRVTYAGREWHRQVEGGVTQA